MNVRKSVRILLLLSIASMVSLEVLGVGACTTRLPFSLDINSSSRIANASEKLTYDSTWYGDQSSTVKFRVNDADLTEAVGVGEKVWEPRRPGMYTLSATTYQDGVIVGDVLSAQFEVVGRDLVNASVTFPDGMPLYDGTVRTPRVEIVYQGETLVEGQDYTLKYEDNISGVGKVIITGIGRFHDEIEKTFKIIPAGICSLDICSNPRKARKSENLTYDSIWYGDQSSTVKLRVNDADLAEAVGVGEKVWEPRRPGMYTLSATTYQDGVIVGEVLSAQFEVLGRDLVNASVAFPDGMPLYDGTERTPRVEIVYQGETLVEGQDYTLRYEDNISGVGKVVITGMGRFHDEIEKTFKIQPAGKCTLDICSGIRKANCPEKITYDENWFSSTGAGYIRIMENGTRVAQENGAGEYSWTATEGGLYTLAHRTYIDGYLQNDKIYTATFGIPGGPLENWDLTVSLEKNVYQYDGSPKTPKVTVKSVLGGLIEGTDFSVAYQNNVEVGTATVIVTGIGIYSGSFTRAFKIVEPVSGAFQQVRQRYPWNGCVDIGVSIKGDSEKEYPTTFTAYDIVGGTNIPMNVVAVVGGTITNKTQSLAPGNYKLIWNADNDLPYEYVNTGVVIRASIEDQDIIAEYGSFAIEEFESNIISLDILYYPASIVDVTNYDIIYGFESGKEWTKDTSNKKVGEFSYKSYAIGHNASTYLTATVKGKGTFSFWWKGSSESNYDWLRYYVNGTEKAKISGTKDWAQVTIPITSTGETVIKWTYSKDGSQSTGSDCGWIDSAWMPDTVLVTNMPPSWTSYVPKDQWIPTRKVTGKEQIVYSSKWSGDGDDDSTSVISVDGTVWKENTGEGVAEWTPDSLGAHILKHTIRGDNGVMGESLRAKFIVDELPEIVEDVPVLKKVVASQRYPWNGLVDVKCVLEGDGVRDYKVTLAVKDEMGGTNLPARTFWQNGGTVTNSVQIVRPGNLHFIWDANADIAEDGEFPAVSVTLKVESSAVPSYTGVVAIEENGYQGAETLTDVPVLVRLGPDTEGFSYSTMAFPDTGADLRFMDWDEKNVLPYEIDEWHNGGESLLWVKLPELKKGTRFKMFYGGAAVSSMNETTHRMGYRGEAVWSDYAGVWHMNEDSGTAYDSTAHGLDGIPSKGTNELADISQMIAYENGACGRARVNGLVNGRGCNFMMVPSASVFSFGGRFVASGWFYGNDKGAEDDPRLITKKNSNIVNPWSGPSGFDINYENSYDNMLFRGSGDLDFTVNMPSAHNNWIFAVAVFDNTSLSVYANGALIGVGEIETVVDNNEYISFGGRDAPFWSLNGQYDEIRLRGGTLSADRIKADYDMIVNRDFLRYGPVESGKGTAE